MPPHCVTPETMIGKPSPFCSELLLQDPNYAAAWFEAAIRNLRLNFTTLYYETGMWKEEVTHMAMAYDAGTDAGTTFTADDMMEDSAKPISMIACGEFDAFCETGDMMPVATITVTKMMM